MTTLYQKIERLIIDWRNDGTKTAGELTGELLPLLSGRFATLIAQHGEWSADTFPKGTAKGALIHARREVEEIMDDMNERRTEKLPEEFADALFCILDSARRANVSMGEIITAGERKLQVNKLRKWRDNGDGSYSHIKEGGAHE